MKLENFERVAEIKTRLDVINNTLRNFDRETKSVTFNQGGRLVDFEIHEPLMIAKLRECAVVLMVENRDALLKELEQL